MSLHVGLGDEDMNKPVQAELHEICQRNGNIQMPETKKLSFSHCKLSSVMHLHYGRVCDVRESVYVCGVVCERDLASYVQLAQVGQ